VVFADRGAVAINRLDYQRREIPSQPVSLLARPKFLTGRDDLLKELHTRLTAVSGLEPRIVALCGLGGVGKTSLALEYAHRHLVETGLAWQLAAEDPAVLTSEFGLLADQLGATDMLHRQDPVKAVHGVLRAYQVEWLLIFDNAPDPFSVEKFVPPAGRGRVLITSQNAHWPVSTLEVPVLDLEVAAGFLISRTRDPDQRAAGDLAFALGGLPLALEQAAAYMTDTGRRLADYLALFRDRPEMLGPVARTWTLAFDQLQLTKPQAVGLLRLLAFCAPAAIPLRLILQSSGGLIRQLEPEVAPVLAPLLEDPVADDDAIRALRQYSLIGPVNGSVSVHGLVQTATRNQIPGEHREHWRQAAAVLIEAAIPADTKSPETWPVCATLAPHAREVLPEYSVGMARIASYLGHSGSHAAARDLQTRIVEAVCRRLDPEHPDAIAARADLAHWTGQAGDAAWARDQFAALLPLRVKVHGPQHRETLIARASMAGWTGEAGDPARARDMFADLVPEIEHAFGKEHQETLTARASLARWTGQAGDPAGARDQFTDLLPVIKYMLGPVHPDALTARHNLAHWMGQAGDAAGAREEFAALLPAADLIFGPTHPATLRARHGLAWWTGEAGDAAVARDMLEKLLPEIERVSGADHPDTRAAQYDLGIWTMRAGDGS